MGRLFTRLVIILKDEPPGPIIIPAPNEVNGVDLLDNVFSTSYLERRCLEIFILSFGNIPPIYIICFSLFFSAALFPSSISQSC